MQQASDLITRLPDKSAQASSTSEHQAEVGLERRKIQTLWALMASMFGHRWVSSYGAKVDPDRVWQSALRGMTETMVKRGLSHVAQSGLEWPPSAPEFRAMCMDDYGEESHWQQRQVAAADRARLKRLRIQHKRTPEEIARGSAVLKALLNGTTPPSISGRPDESLTAPDEES